jgi:hypothetical protein
MGDERMLIDMGWWCTRLDIRAVEGEELVVEVADGMVGEYVKSDN